MNSTVVTRVAEWRAERGSGALELSPPDAAVCPLKSLHLHVAGERASYGSEVASPLSPRRPSTISRGKW